MWRLLPETEARLITDYSGASGFRPFVRGRASIPACGFAAAGVSMNDHAPRNSSPTVRALRPDLLGVDKVCAEAFGQVLALDGEAEVCSFVLPKH